jgi:hypothetical protein
LETVQPELKRRSTLIPSTRVSRSAMRACEVLLLWRSHFPEDPVYIITGGRHKREKI